ncbi:MAG TPA: hypothetical protein DDY21_00120 [Candidatus Moranbacteria bacterium]|nr:hypothetical protein [Candidatus Moranbacteria bacterium]
METNKFEEKALEKSFADFLQETAENDLKKISIPQEVLNQIDKLNKIREELDPYKINDFLVPLLLTRQTEILNAKYLIGRHLSLTKGTQSYAYIFRKFQSASDYNPTKERLEVISPSKRPTVGEIESEIEAKMLQVRKTEIAYQIAGDKLVCLLSWCDQMIMAIQNRLRDENTDRRSTYAGNNSQQAR